MIRVPYKVVAPVIDALYAKEFPLNANQAIKDHIQVIVDTLHILGWTEEEYMHAYIGAMETAPEDLTSDLGDLHCKNNQPN